MFTYGNRNVQGVAVQPGTGRLFGTEHGPHVDDEINVLRAGANYGWDPSRGGTRDRNDHFDGTTVGFARCAPAMTARCTSQPATATTTRCSGSHRPAPDIAGHPPLRDCRQRRGGQ